MENGLAFIIGALYAAALYMMLQKSIVKLIIGLVFLFQASNLLIFTSSGLIRSKPPIIPNNQTILSLPYADPLPQALIITALVIGFGILAFAMVLVHRIYQTVGTDNQDNIKGSDS